MSEKHATGSRVRERCDWCAPNGYPYCADCPNERATRDRAADTIARPVVAEADALRVALRWFVEKEDCTDLDRAAYESIRDTLIEQGIIR